MFFSWYVDSLGLENLLLADADTRLEPLPPLQRRIPAVSEWGLVVMTLLLLTGIKIKFGRRRSAEA